MSDANGANHQVFETIWSNDTLRRNIWPDLNDLTTPQQIAEAFIEKRANFFSRLDIDNASVFDDFILSFINVK